MFGKKAKKLVCQKAMNRARFWAKVRYVFHSIGSVFDRKTHERITVKDDLGFVVEIKCSCGKSFWKYERLSIPGFSGRVIPTIFKDPFKL